ncbi:peroxisome assembly protein 26 [Melanotaenia boesemani]|uniref:peroxisome assembly protein 26 n=1 Tax=Melanotaenia boesemani TaxID=1250792 RepID=UPI001C0427F4|nr:peroxisome assembly protein 26 [Melanotaenia boesemani]XP_041833169.1 peroxisome assembly protein 26 [Melanotaenia boesemani]
MSSSSSQTALARSFGAVCSPPSSSALSQTPNMLDSAAEQMMVHKDFQATFDACEKGLQSLANMDQEDNRCVELKAGFCILGIQALAELNQWHGVLSWVLQQYGHVENIPAKIMQMCILLYSKVDEPAVMQEAAGVWLRCSSNCRAAGFRTVAELYLLHVLVPLGHAEEARELIAGEVGAVAFTEDQRQTALDVVEEKERQREEPPPHPRIGPGSEMTAHPVSSPGSVIHKIEAMLRFLYRKLLLTGSGSFPLRKVFLVAVLLYMIFFRLDPALPSSFLWISKLLQLLKQMWRAMFAPYYKALADSQGL